MIKSPLRYPGGKSKAISKIAKYMPKSFAEYREPFVGGGSFFLYIRQKYPQMPTWINDLNEELFRFWKCSQLHLTELVERVEAIKQSSTSGRELFESLVTCQTSALSDVERACRFFVLNRITFSGTVESGGYSEEAFKKRFTDSSIKRLEALKPVLSDIRITDLDYSEVVKTPGENVFLFLDPPYYSVSKSKLYGRKGDLHVSFDHRRFAEAMEKTTHRFLITYDDCKEVRKNFKFANIYEWELQYGMNNYKQEKAAKGKELFITNYEIDQEPIDQMR